MYFEFGKQKQNLTGLCEISSILWWQSWDFLGRINKYSLPMLGQLRNSFSNNTFPIKPVAPVIKMFLSVYHSDTFELCDAIFKYFSFLKFYQNCIIWKKKNIDKNNIIEVILYITAGITYTCK